MFSHFQTHGQIEPPRRDERLRQIDLLEGLSRNLQLIGLHPRTVEPTYLLHVMILKGGQPRTSAASNVSDRARSKKPDDLGDDLRGRVAGALRNSLIKRPFVWAWPTGSVSIRSLLSRTVINFRCPFFSKSESTHSRRQVNRFGGRC